MMHFIKQLFSHLMNNIINLIFLSVYNRHRLHQICNVNADESIHCMKCFEFDKRYKAEKKLRSSVLLSLNVSISMVSFRQLCIERWLKNWQATMFLIVKFFSSSSEFVIKNWMLRRQFSKQKNENQKKNINLHGSLDDCLRVT